MKRIPNGFWLLALVAVTISACRNEMYDQPKAEPLEQSLFFADSQASRPMVEGTVARESRTASAMSNGGASDVADMYGAAPKYSPLATANEIRTMSLVGKVSRRMLDRGHERYDIYCSPCHGRTGDGNGMIVQRGFPPPPSLHLERLRTAADGHYYDVITNGFGLMYNYANRVKPNDRWAIAAYIRALQLARNPNAPVRTAPTLVKRNGVDESRSMLDTTGDK